MEQKKLSELIHVSYLDGIGPKKLQYLIKFSQRLASIWQIPSEQIRKILGPSLENDFFQTKQDFYPEEMEKNLANHQINVLSYDDPDYPQLLLEIPDYPPILFYQGSVSLLNNQFPKLAVVGSRKYSFYGQSMIEKLIPKLSEENFIIISGLALGIDALAHEQSLKNQGLTIAVLGCGLDMIYPQENFRLAKNIIDNQGLIVSEFPPGVPPLKQHFPRRNRLIAGLAQGVLVIEAAEQSGSLITAHLALDYNRDVFAIPGDIERQTSIGSNNLIKNGAIMVTGVEDILNAWQIEKHQTKNLIIEKYSPQEQALLELLSQDKLNLDQLIIKLNWPTNQAAQLLTQLELVGAIENCGGGYYKIK